jgi:hypothetical protein
VMDVAVAAVAVDVVAVATATNIAAVPNSCNPGTIWCPSDSLSHSTAKE